MQFDTHSEWSVAAMSANTDDLVLSPAQASARYGYKTKTWSNWRNLGKGPRYVIVHGRPRYRVEDIERWLARKPKGGQRA